MLVSPSAVAGGHGAGVGAAAVALLDRPVARFNKVVIVSACAAVCFLQTVCLFVVVYLDDRMLGRVLLSSLVLAANKHFC